MSPYIDGARNPADILTKNLGQILFYQLHSLLGLEILWTLLLIYIVTQWPLLWVRGSVKLNNYCTVYYCSLIYEPCLHKQACFFVSTAMSWNLSRSLFPIKLSINICWIISQMVTYYLWWVLWYFKEFKNVKLDKWQKMLLSLRSNSQIGSSYIQKSDGLCTRTDHHMLLPIILHMVVPLC